MPADVLSVEPLTTPVDATVRPPGSKSITNRALLCAALAPGTSTLTGVLFADDTRAMMSAVAALGATVVTDEPACTVTVTGIDPAVTGGAGTIDARQSGTTSRFVLPAAALLRGRTVVDGTEQLRARPFGPVHGSPSPGYASVRGNRDATWKPDGDRWSDLRQSAAPTAARGNREMPAGK